MVRSQMTMSPGGELKIEGASPLGYPLYKTLTHVLSVSVYYMTLITVPRENAGVVILFDLHCVIPII